VLSIGPIRLLARELLVERRDTVAQLDHRDDRHPLARMCGVLDARLELRAEGFEDAAHDDLLLRGQRAARSERDGLDAPANLVEILLRPLGMRDASERVGHEETV